MNFKNVLLVTAVVGVQLLISCSSSVENSTIPKVPQGQWEQYSLKSFGGGNELGFINFMTAYNNQLAIAGTDTNMRPALILCKNNITSCGNYTNSGLSNVNAISALEFDNFNNLYGTFVVPQDDFFNPNRANVMKLPANTSVWLTFNSTNGQALGLDVTPNSLVFSSSSFKIPVPGTGLVHYGSVSLFNSNDKKIANAVNRSAGALSYVVSDGANHTYVAGPEVYSDRTSASEFFVWAWNINESSFKEIESAGVSFSMINGMTSNNNGVIYISGQDQLSATHIWQYNGTQLQDLQFPGYTVSSIAYLPYQNTKYGYVLVGGTDQKFNGQVWVYNTQLKVWSSLEITDSSEIGAIAADPTNGQIYVSGQDERGLNRVWTFFN